MSDKSLPPTDKRLRDARKEGNAARSDVLAGLFVAVLTVEVAFVSIDANLARWLRLQDAVFAQLGAPDRTHAWLGLCRQAIRLVAVAILPVVAAAVVGSIAAAWLIGGLSLAPKAVGPSLKRLNATKHLKGLFGANNLVSVALALASAGLLATVAYWQLRERLPIVDSMIAWQALQFDLQAGITLLHGFVRMLLAALLVPVALAAIVAKRQHRQGLRMSHRELKDELKHANGNPLIRSHQRAQSHEAAASVSTRVRGGKRALVTNPEHIAVMLDYAADASQAPIVIGKATDDGALSLTNSALLERIPVFRCRPLARHLFQHGELHAAIPPDCYRAVAIVYRIVDEIEHLEERPNVPIEIDDVVFDP
ncbi:MAG TPA: EscU/YscU/HrcU family type III secretion system export apparatus switch protein [Trinickia sp.]|uniref:EscU/YscU/HrcU family type III secretion system export apparatus switch protein n=1 Tax=Trinickia sp. TaxID=2571163 RepID=UPI002CC58895|nr:EscU/YscU/HrcU family type III secretion system export apparatus switch protein [Trinickia sp.]HVW51687.1 EscU/YscU/HrcU family type III secretion system export apparatus switch protein [Trinickia sp.]